jgi:hypothetical protein
LRISGLLSTLANMSNVEEIEIAIDRLSDTEVSELKTWIWDRDIVSDAGRLDELADEALNEHRAGKTRKL